MAIPVRETIPTYRENYSIQVTDDGSKTLLRNDTGDAFHSGCGAISETRHVYVESSGVQVRLTERMATDVLEMGLGTAMAMLMTVDCALRNAAKLHYVALELDWLSVEMFRLLEPGRWGLSRELVMDYERFRSSCHPPCSPQQARYAWTPNDQILVEVHVGDARSWSPDPEQQFDAIYFDPFAPESVPELWTAEFLSQMRRLTRVDGRLTTYSCSRRVRDAMEMAGFKCNRIPGPPGGKREILVATPAQESGSV